MNIWFANRRTGRYPPLRILWNILTGIPVGIVVLILCGMLVLHSGTRDIDRVWGEFF